MSEYINRAIELAKLNFDFLFDYWWLHIGIIIIASIIELKIISKKEQS